MNITMKSVSLFALATKKTLYALLMEPASIHINFYYNTGNYSAHKLTQTVGGYNSFLSFINFVVNVPTIYCDAYHIFVDISFVKAAKYFCFSI